MAILRNRLPEDFKGGQIDEVIVVKRYADKDVITDFPDMTKVILSENQKHEQNRFKEAVTFARAICADPEKKARYKNLARPRQKVYHAIIADFMKKAPEPEPEPGTGWYVTASDERYPLKRAIRSSRSEPSGE